MVVEHEFPGDVIEGDVGEEELPLEHLVERREARGPDEDHVVTAHEPDHLTCSQSESGNLSQSDNGRMGGVREPE